MSIKVRVNEFKEYFKNNFDFSVIKDSDIEISLQEAFLRLAYCLKNSDFANFSFLYLAAHLLYLRLEEDLNKASFKSSIGIISAEKLDNLMVHYSIPNSFLKNERYIFFLSSAFGIRYLDYLLSSTKQFIGLVRGRTQPD